MSEKSANDILLGAGGGKSAAFPRIGTIVSGEVISEPESREQTDMITKLVKTFKDGTPMMQVLIRLQTQERDPNDPEDDGVRTVYAKGKMVAAIGKAMRAAKVSALEIGGFLEIAYIGDGPKGDMPIPPKLFEARYTPPAPQAAGSFFLNSAAAPQSSGNGGTVVIENQHRAQDAPSTAPARTTLDQIRNTSYSAQGVPQFTDPPF